MLLRVKLTTDGNPKNVAFDGSVLAVVGRPPEVVLWGSRMFVLADGQVGDGTAKLPLLYREGRAMPAIETPADDAGA